MIAWKVGGAYHAFGQSIDPNWNQDLLNYFGDSQSDSFGLPTGIDGVSGTATIQWDSNIVIEDYSCGFGQPC